MKKSALFMTLALTICLWACGGTTGSNSSPHGSSSSGSTKPGSTEPGKTDPGQVDPNNHNDPTTPVDPPPAVTRGEECQFEDEGMIACADNIIAICSDGFWSDYKKCDEGQICVSSIKDPDNLVCGTPCNDTSNNQTICQEYEEITDHTLQLFVDINDAEGITINYACSKATNGNMYIFMEYDYCLSGCNEAKNGCLTNSKEEGKSCNISSTFQEYCDGNIAVYCQDEIVRTKVCENDLSCNVMADKNWAACSLPCTDNDVFVCDDTYKNSNGIEILYTYECQNTKDGHKAAFYLDQKVCSSCENNNVCENDQDGSSLNVNDSCNINLFRDRCLDNSILSCSYSSDGTTKVTVNPCEKEESCYKILDNDFDRSVICLNSSKLTTCSADAPDIVSCYGTQGFYYSTQSYCVNVLDRDNNSYYFYLGGEYTECNDSCNESTGLCM